MKRTILIILLGMSVCFSLNGEPIKLHPSNPHYFLYKGKPTLLITSAEHYGAVVNGDFDYKTYLKALKAYGLNYTRIYPGGLFEPKDKFIKGNTLGIVPGNMVLPWARSDKPGYSGGGNLFDLDKWNPAYFSRLKDFVREAAKQDVVVEICFYNAQYNDTWPIHPLYFKNNIQGEGNYHFNDFQTLKHPDLVKRQDDYVRKIVQEVHSFDNVILEICDEPLLNGTPVKEAGAWISHNIDVIKDTESKFSQEHLIAQQLEGPENGPVDFSNNPDVSVIVAQYVWAAGDQMGGMQALDKKYAANKAIELNETDYYPVWYGKENDKVAASRVEAWEFMVGGGAGFNQLNGLYTAANPAGKTADNDQIGKALQSLKKFLYSFDFLRMAPDKNFIVSGVEEKGAFSRCISEPGKQYAFYIHHSTRPGETSYHVSPGKYKEDLVVNLPKGDYLIEWINPADGKIISNQKIKVTDGKTTLTTPEYNLDLALRIKLMKI
jgi:hypothetical protein